MALWKSQIVVFWVLLRQAKLSKLHAWCICLLFSSSDFPRCLILMQPECASDPKLCGIYKPVSQLCILPACFCIPTFLFRHIKSLKHVYQKFVFFPSFVRAPQNSSTPLHPKKNDFRGKPTTKKWAPTHIFISLSAYSLRSHRCHTHRFPPRDLGHPCFPF